ncbi:MAG: S8 family peptidase [Armatimonadetes bacterium]|nr:S8 family peptidase [Armatimonadota bacterium]
MPTIQPAAASQSAPPKRIASRNLPEDTSPRDVLIFPAAAGDAAEARQQLGRARELLQKMGSRVAGELPTAGGLKTKLDGGQAEQLKKAGFQVVEDREIQVLRPSPSLRPGWMLTPNRMEAAMAALDRADAGPAPEKAAEPESRARASSFFDGPGGGGDPFFPMPRPMPLRRYSGERLPEGPGDFVGPLPRTGKGVTIAILDTGVYPHPDLKERLVGFASATSYGGRVEPDAMGHGTHVAADAAGDGSLSNGRLKGPAPDASIVGIQVLGSEDGRGSLSEVIENVTRGIDWMVENKDRYGIKVANLSLGIPLMAQRERFFGPATLFDPIGAAIDRAVSAGITVVAAAGNSGSDRGTIEESPAINENVITVGALDTRGTPRDRSDDSVADFSSRGPTPDGRVKPDILAPGVNILAANAPHSVIEQQNAMIGQVKERLEEASDRAVYRMAQEMVYSGMAPPQLLRMPVWQIREMLMEGLEVHPTAGRLEGASAYIAMDGTSMAAPIVTGVVAAMLEANPNLAPDQVKRILMGTADPLPGVGSTSQGAGVINGRKAVEYAAAAARRAV